MRGPAGFGKSVMRFVVVIAFALCAATITNAYILVMRDGRRIQIADQFTVTQTTLSYPVAPTIEVTIPLAAIDVSATERLNNEAPGSLSRRAAISSPSATERSRTAVAAKVKEARTVTNKDLESFARARRESEAAYEKRRIELGLPSLAESRRKAAADAESLAQFSAEKLAADQQAEGYWRARASELRNELAATNEEIDLVQAELLEFPAPVALLPGTGFPPYIGRRGPRRRWFGFERDTIVLGNRGFMPQRPTTFAAPNARVVFDPGARLSKSRALTAFGAIRRGTRGPDLPFAGSVLLDASFQHFPFWSQGNPLGDLFVYRASLEARLRDLEDEARRAGVPPGWLRP